MAIEHGKEASKSRTAGRDGDLRPGELVARVQYDTVHTEPLHTHLNRAGEGGDEAILFLHGAGPGATAWSNWQRALPALGEQYDCLAPDFVGFGDSGHPDPAPQGPHGVKAWMRLRINQILSLLDVMGIETTHLVGNSMGGAVALHLLMEAPERFDRVVLMGPAGTTAPITLELQRMLSFYENPSAAAMARLISWFVYDVDALGAELEEIAEERYEAAMRPEVRCSYEAMFSAVPQLSVPESALRRMHHPFLLVHGADDAIIPLEASYYLAKHLPNFQMHVYGHCGHWTQLEYPDSFNRLLMRFFNEAL